MDAVGQDVDNTAQIAVIVTVQAGRENGASAGGPAAARTIPVIMRANTALIAMCVQLFFMVYSFLRAYLKTLDQNR